MASRYKWNLTVCTGKQDPASGIGHAQTITMDFADGLLGHYRTVVADNFFANVSIARCLSQNDTYLIGTLRTTVLD